jgi:GTPase SAR1 family protein
MQERYIHMTNVYYRNADFCLIMFDLTNRDSFEACSRWKNDLDIKYKLSDGFYFFFINITMIFKNNRKMYIIFFHNKGTKCPCLLVGNKVLKI